MGTGTIETISKINSKQRRMALAGGSDSGNGNRNSGGGSDDNSLDENVIQPDKSRILMWFLLLAVTMTFGGLIAAYIVIQNNNVPEWKPFKLPIQVWISSILILLSSISYYFATQSVMHRDQKTAKKWLIVTTVLGAAFISSQILAWLELTKLGLYMSGNPYGGFFYILTAVHAIHVLGGVIALGSVLLSAWNYTDSDIVWYRLQTITPVVGWYWHFMGLLWLVLFVLLGFWK